MALLASRRKLSFDSSGTAGGVGQGMVISRHPSGADRSRVTATLDTRAGARRPTPRVLFTFFDSVLQRSCGPAPRATNIFGTGDDASGCS